MEQHREDIVKYREKKAAALAQLEAQWKVEKANPEADADKETAKGLNAIDQITEHLGAHVEEQRKLIAKLKETLPNITRVAYRTPSEETTPLGNQAK